MPKYFCILIFLFLALSQSICQELISAQLYEDESLNISIQHHQKANVLVHDWLSIIFHNKSEDAILIDKFQYTIKYDTLGFDQSKKRRNSMGQGNIYDVFPLFENKKSPNQYDMVILPGEKIKCYRGISNYASVLLGHENQKDLSIDAQLKSKCEYEIHGKMISFEDQKADFNFRWTTTKNKNAQLAERLFQACDSISLRGNGWIIIELAKDTNITSYISEERYVDLIAKRHQNAAQYNRAIIGSFFKHYNHNDKINQYFISEMATADWSLLQDLEFYWHDSFLEPLVKSFQKINEHHHQYLKLLDNHYVSWKDDAKLKSALFKQIKEYAHEVLVENAELTFKNKSGWQIWITELSKSHSTEAEMYFKTFFGNEMPLFNEQDDPLMICGNFPPFYPATRICDAALEAFIHCQNGELSKIYSDKFEDLIEKGILKEPEQKHDFLYKTEAFMNVENMLAIRNALIKDYQ